MIFLTTTALLITAGISTPLTMGAVVIQIRKFIRTIDRREVSTRMQQMAVQAIDQLDNPSGSTTAPVAPVSQNPRTRKQQQMQRRHKYASKLAVMCRANINGVERKTEANRAVIAHFVNRQMAIDNVRICDMNAIRRATILFVFTPTEDDVFYSAMEHSIPFIDREVAGNRDYRSTRSWYDWFTLRFKTRSDPVARA